MKTIILLMANIFCLSAYASNVTSEKLSQYRSDSVQTVSGPELEEYKEAVRLALWGVPSDCTNIVNISSPDYSMLEEIKLSSLLHVNVSGAQPLLVFKLDGSETGYQGIISIKTSADYKTILEVYREHYKVIKVNKGDLRNPRFEMEPYYRFKQLCTIKN